MTVRFTQPCPTCGRRIQVRASLMGRTVACQHCNAEFIAQHGMLGESVESREPGPTSDPLMARVEEALERAQREQTAVTG